MTSVVRLEIWCEVSMDRAHTSDHPVLGVSVDEYGRFADGQILGLRKLGFSSQLSGSGPGTAAPYVITLESLQTGVSMTLLPDDDDRHGLDLWRAWALSMGGATLTATEVSQLPIVIRLGPLLRQQNPGEPEYIPLIGSDA